MIQEQQGVLSGVAQGPGKGRFSHRCSVLRCVLDRIPSLPAITISEVALVHGCRLVRA